MKDAAGLIPLLSVAVDEAFLQKAPKLKIIANYAVGYDNIDLQAATRRGIVVTNTPDVLTNATADLAFALLLSAARRLGEAERLLRAGQWRGWQPNLLLGQELSGKTLGIVGAGRIGRAMLRRARGFDMQLRYTSPSRSPQAEELGAQQIDLQDLLRESDFLSLHCPLNASTANILDKDAFEIMKSSAVIVNTARGGCVDASALAYAIKNGEIAGAGLDVFEQEPAVASCLLASERIVLAPHIGSATAYARGRMTEICARAVRDVLSGVCPPTALNPQVMA